MAHFASRPVQKQRRGARGSQLRLDARGHARTHHRHHASGQGRYARVWYVEGTGIGQTVVAGSLWVGGCLRWEDCRRSRKKGVSWISGAYCGGMTHTGVGTRLLLQETPPLPQMCGSEAKKFCVPKIGLKLPAPRIHFIFCLRKNFSMWVGGSVGWGWPGPQTTPPPQGPYAIA